MEAGFASESRLAQELGVSRMTARAALVRLERDGLVSCA
ncbi:GntR family transcriptional regulator [Nonomuraea sp. NEAU-L178]|nr:GntR family transcriptional regulator [Nonomuraea aurantiaca]